MYARYNKMNPPRVFMAPVTHRVVVLCVGSQCIMVKHPVRSLAPLPYMVMPRNFLREITANYFRNILLTIYGT